MGLRRFESYQAHYDQLLTQGENAGLFPYCRDAEWEDEIAGKGGNR
jgi:hypothetical protein